MCGCVSEKGGETRGARSTRRRSPFTHGPCDGPTHVAFEAHACIVQTVHTQPQPCPSREEENKTQAKACRTSNARQTKTRRIGELQRFHLASILLVVLWPEWIPIIWPILSLVLFFKKTKQKKTQNKNKNKNVLFLFKAKAHHLVCRSGERQGIILTQIHRENLQGVLYHFA